MMISRNIETLRSILKLVFTNLIKKAVVAVLDQMEFEQWLCYIFYCFPLQWGYCVIQYDENMILSKTICEGLTG